MSFSFIHTSDWHLGKKLFKESRLTEQGAFLSWLLVQIKKSQPTTLCISGDIFDTPHPSSEAQSLYYQFLKEAVSENDLEIFIISGNHDSGRFLEAPLPFLKEKSIQIVGSLTSEEKTYSYHREGVSYHLLPYFRSHQLFNYARIHFPELLEGLSSHDSDPIQLITSLFHKLFNFKAGNKNVLMAHHLFGNGELSGSELGLSLSGLDSIPLSILKEKFDYVALGHLHNHQYLSKKEPVICYSGSPIAFRFSERKNKRINLINETKNDLAVSEIIIPEFRKLYELKLNESNYKENLLELVKNQTADELESYLEVQLTSDKPLRGAADKVREILEDSSIKLLSLQTKLIGSQINKNQDIVQRDSSPEVLFKNFYLEKFSGETEVPIEINNLFNELLEEARGEE